MSEDERAPQGRSDLAGPIRSAVTTCAGTAIGWAWIAGLDLLATFLADIVLADGETARATSRDA